MDEPERPTGPKCINCDSPMRHTRTSPASGGLPEVHSFECTPCHIAVSHAVEEPSG